MPVVRIAWWKGRTREQKEKVAMDIEESMVKNIGCPKGVTHIVFEDVDKSDWAIEGKLQG
ncbi:MAG: 4-oxalocrotonate tautomerase family protein [Candidatus Saganbacteria bacterium]|nr:4-oxalocrotonate tautomerase family protein [Candidatus Saganbacteria bacterium]